MIKTIVKAISLQPEIARDIDSRPDFNFSGWVQKKYKEEFMRLDSLLEKQKELIEEMRRIEAAIQSMKNRDLFERMQPVQREWIATEGCLQADIGRSLQQIVMAHNKRFQQVKITADDMREILEKHGKWVE